MEGLASEHLCDLSITVASPVSTGATPAGERRIVTITGGTFEGSRLKGTVLPGGADWIWVEPDGMVRLDVRATLRTEDGASIYVQYKGLRHGPADVIARMNAGEEVDPSQYYFRVAMTFETGDARYDWLNRTLAVGTGHRRADGPVYRVFRIL